MNKYIKNMDKEESIILNIKKLYDFYGYKKITLPIFEDYDFYNNHKDFIFGSTLTIMGPTGKLLALRPDTTLSIAKKISKEKEQIFKTDKIYYEENVYKHLSSSGYTEIAQIGVEKIGKESLYSNYEVVDLAIKSLNEINKNYILVLSHIGVVSSIFENINLDNNLKDNIFKCIQNKNSHDIKKILENVNLNEEIKKLIYILPSLSGDKKTILKKLENIKLENTTNQIINNMIKLYDLLTETYSKSKIIIDFSIVENLKYYNGIIIQGYVKGMPEAILTGGRYDKLFHKLGLDSGAIGFAILIDKLKMYYDEKEKKDYDTFIVTKFHDENDEINFIKLINKEFIEKGKKFKTISNLDYSMKKINEIIKNELDNTVEVYTYSIGKFKKIK